MAWSTDELGDCSGQRVLITGANSGIGLETARQLVAHGARVTMGCRDTAKGNHAAASLSDPGAVTVRELDLASLASVRQFAAAAAEDGPFTAYVANAGVMACPYRLSADGYELQMATNHFGHALLTALLWPALARSARTVIVSSLAARGGKLSPSTTREDLIKPEPYDRQRVYSNTKQANLLFAQELQRRAGGGESQMTVVAAHPGVSMTELFPRQLRDAGHGWLVPIVRPFLYIALQPARAGAWPTLRALSDPKLTGGEFVGPRGPGQIRGRPEVIDLYPQGADTKAAARLWDLTEEVLATKLPG
jgi:NAD(P)-dependent dehydrogenase (short-subunit alcohol dehydrogenase family)